MPKRGIPISLHFYWKGIHLSSTTDLCAVVAPKTVVEDARFSPDRRSFLWTHAQPQSNAAADTDTAYASPPLRCALRCRRNPRCRRTHLLHPAGNPTHMLKQAERWNRRAL